jgi:hypothetical protein
MGNEDREKDEGLKWFDEDKLIPDRWSWVILVLFSAGIVIWGLLVYRFVHDGPRAWDYGKLVDTPGESVYWTVEPPRGAPVPRQMPELPNARPLKTQPAEKKR